MQPTVQEPQCCVLVERSKQPPPAVGSPFAQQVWLPTQSGAWPHLQTPRTQAAPVEQRLPQVPQLPRSLVGSTHVLPQQICPIPQALPLVPHWHVPPEQVSPCAQAWPQAPQFFTSVAVWEQPLPQQASPLLHTAPLHAQFPFEQESGEAQARPQVPQLALSLIRSTHCEPPQQIFGAPHAPAEPHGQEPVVEQPVAQHSGFWPPQAAPP